MALITCKECGKDISDQAGSCPNCGCPISNANTHLSETVQNKKVKFKGGKLTIGIISIVLFVLVSFQSCAAGIGNALSESGETSGSSGFILAIFMLIAGILTIVNRSRTNKASFIVPACFYILGGLIARVEIGSYKDLELWTGLSIFFGILMLIFMAITIKEKSQ